MFDPIDGVLGAIALAVVGVFAWGFWRGAWKICLFTSCIIMILGILAGVFAIRCFVLDANRQGVDYTPYAAVIMNLSFFIFSSLCICGSLILAVHAMTLRRLRAIEEAIRLMTLQPQGLLVSAESAPATISSASEAY